MSKRKINSSNTSPSKKRNKYYVSFNNDWLKDNLCKEWLKKSDQFSASCVLCKSDFSIKYEGFCAIENHSKSDKHKKSSLVFSKNDTINQFLYVKNTKEEDKVTTPEISFVYH